MGGDVLSAEPLYTCRALSAGDRLRTQLGARVECWRPKRVNRPAGLPHSPSTPASPHAVPCTLPLAPVLLLCTLSLLPPRRYTLALLTLYTSLHLVYTCIFLAFLHFSFHAACHTLPTRRYTLALLIPHSSLHFFHCIFSNPVSSLLSFTPLPPATCHTFPPQYLLPCTLSP